MSVTTTAIDSEEHSGPAPIVDPWDDGGDGGIGITSAGPTEASATGSAVDAGPIAAAINASRWTREDLELLATVIGIVSPMVAAALILLGVR